MRDEDSTRRGMILIGVVLFLCSCADSPPVQVDVAIETFCADPYGFWGGLWHGLSAWFHFFGSLFDDSIDFYAACNGGHWYDAGFALGVGVFSSSAGAATRSSS